MSDEILPAPAAPVAAVPETAAVFLTAPVPRLLSNADEVLPAIADPVRWRILRALQTGAALTSNELAVLAHRRREVTCKHLAVLLKAGLVVSTADVRDQRRQVYTLAPAIRPTDPANPELDLGCVVLRLASHRAE